jgi:NAD(P)-dependent dehydrogenase (short-subunit alcohol dehydrogenase family)
MGHYVVVGGSSGIGAAIVEALLDTQHQVTNCDIVPSPAQAEYVAMDVASPASVKRASVEITGPVDGYVHAAGIQIAVPIEAMTDEDIARQVLVNVNGPVLVAKYLSPLLNRGGSVVLVGSELVFVGTAQSPVYAATKGAVVSLARSLAVAWRERAIRVNALCPGATRTPLLQGVWQLSANPDAAEAEDTRGVLLGRLGTPQEIAQAALFLLSAASSFVDGHALVADGGTIIW